MSRQAEWAASQYSRYLYTIRWPSMRSAWRAHRKIRNHTYNLHLGQTEDLTITILEQAAATLQAHLS